MHKKGWAFFYLRSSRPFRVWWSGWATYILVHTHTNTVYVYEIHTYRIYGVYAKHVHSRTQRMSPDA